MNQKKARLLRKVAKYDPGEDPIADRKYRYLTCVASVDRLTRHKPYPIRKQKTGEMRITSGKRLAYRQMKKLYKEGVYERN